jgi:ABC-type transporter Mla maintaining outer membrane lipid asymmetry ATPase subunit MlaF
VSELVVHYERRTPHHHVVLSVPTGKVTRAHLPDEAAKAHLVTALLKARGEPNEELELFGTPTVDLKPRERDRVRARIGAVSPVVGLMTNLNAWENISLPAAYHGTAPLEDVVTLAHEVITAFGAEPQVFLSRLPDELSTLERKIAAFVRLLVSAPELMIFDALEDGLSHAECKRVASFEAVYRAYQPAGTVLYVDTREDS